MKIKKINHGIAYRVGNTIFINSKIKNKELYDSLIAHEKEHTKKYKIKDILLDMNGKHLSNTKKEYYQFLLFHPSSWTIFLPFMIHKKKILMDPIFFIIWIIFFFLLYFILK